jgi:NAD(P)-dependent dehydrogenase (short-subunit alcohol dehydrogenase family)
MTVSYDFDGKAVLVTGGASGVGNATAALFSSAGARVVMADVNAKALDAAGAGFGDALGRSVFTAEADVSDSGSCARLVERSVELLGKLDIVCNVAGVLTAGPTEEFSDESWQLAIGVNLSGPFFLSRSALPHLVQTGGCIVNVASTAGLIGVPRGAAYSASKSGVIGLTKALATEYAKRGVRVNAVCPGHIATPMSASGAGFGPGADGALLARLAPLNGRAAQPDEIASAIAFLASSPSATGAILTVDGGQTAI